MILVANAMMIARRLLLVAPNELNEKSNKNCTLLLNIYHAQYTHMQVPPVPTNAALKHGPVPTSRKTEVLYICI